MTASFYGPNCDQKARTLRDGLWIVQNWETAEQIGLNIRDTSGPIIVPEQVNRIWYRRADVTVRIIQTVVRRYEVMNILSAQGLIVGDAGRAQTVDDDWNTENVA